MEEAVGDCWFKLTNSAEAASSKRATLHLRTKLFQLNQHEFSFIANDNNESDFVGWTLPLAFLCAARHS